MGVLALRPATAEALHLNDLNSQGIINDLLFPPANCKTLNSNIQLFCIGS